MKLKYVFMATPLWLLVSCATPPIIKKEVVKSVPTAGLPVVKTVLPNGLTVLISPNHKLPIASYYTWFDVGGRYEGNGTTGATHFLEHMMFKGAKKYGPGQFHEMIERNGGDANAYTTMDATVYHESIPSDIIPQMIDVEADRLQNLLLEPTSFESERMVVFEERKMRYENSPDGMIYQLMMKEVFKNTPYGQSVIGEVSDLKNLSRDQVMNFFKTYYTPDNAIIAIVGDVDPDKTLTLIKEKYGNIPPAKKLSELKAAKDDAKNYQFTYPFRKEIKSYATNPTPKFHLAFRGEKIGTHRQYVLDILASMLSSGESSYLTQKYVLSPSPTLMGISLNSYNLNHSGVFYFAGELLENVNIDDFKITFMKDLKFICQEALNEHELKRAKNQIMASAYDQMKTTSGVASVIIHNEKMHGDPNFGIKELSIYMGINLSEVKEACHQMMDQETGIFISVWNQFPKMKE